MLEHGHNPYLVAASFAIAVMAGFTGLLLTRGASTMPVERRKLAVAMSAVALGGGIWSMHFVAMLGLRLPVLFYYDALTTMISALVAILLTGIALLLVHFGERTRQRIMLGGACLGVGIPVMHYLGMSGMQIAEPVYSVFGIIIAFISSLVLCMGSFWICYGEREARNFLLGTLGFGITVCAVHFISMAGTHFVEVPGTMISHLRLDNEVLAFGVTLSSFVIAGAFLLVAVTFEGRAKPAEGQAKPAPLMALSPDNHPPEDGDNAPGEEPLALRPEGRIPYEKNGRIFFVPEAQVAAVRAEGHYTFLYHSSGKLFCPWSISEFEKHMNNEHFLKCHRSYLVNTNHVSGFERKKDNGVCYFDANIPLKQVPVSRSYLKQMRAALGL